MTLESTACARSRIIDGMPWTELGDGPALADSEQWQWTTGSDRKVVNAMATWSNPVAMNNMSHYDARMIQGIHNIQVRLTTSQAETINHRHAKAEAGVGGSPTARPFGTKLSRGLPLCGNVQDAPAAMLLPE
ncbi:hypothetical protein AK812_SmicGene41548 [Symbiodinium microadriaticum]|uniref:Uncharacterized protein n=1 Tax=Symbiodinium microadriaticum TaxID=2951 RepID=A0A1Q9C5T5_SYMMI|nr:hypothetical protein AK812_SmicGene41548 [Symbiodinium microadriaticum]